MSYTFRLILIACMLLAVCASAQTATAMKFTFSYANFPPAKTFPSVQMEQWAKEVERRTGGMVEIQTYPGSTLLGAKNMFHGVKQGQADIGCISIAYQPGVFPVTSVLEVPMGFNNAVVPSLVLWDLYEKYKPKEFEDVVVLTMFTSAPSNIMSKVPVKSLADMKGLELRASGGASKVLGKLGATPVSMPMPETPEALQKGIVKGLLSSFDVLKDFNFAEECRHQTVTNFQVYPFAVIMNKDSWNKLPGYIKLNISDLAREHSIWTGDYLDKHVNESLEWSKEKYDIAIHELPAADKAEIDKRLAPMVEDWKKMAKEKGLPAEQILEDVKTLKAKHEEKYVK
jgi:TRAP-type C4-dicarboxylate transport system substrate-binding protein